MLPRCIYIRKDLCITFSEFFFIAIRHQHHASTKANMIKCFFQNKEAQLLFHLKFEALLFLEGLMNSRLKFASLTQQEYSFLMLLLFVNRA